MIFGQLCIFIDEDLTGLFIKNIAAYFSVDEFF